MESVKLLTAASQLAAGRPQDASEALTTLASRESIEATRLEIQILLAIVASTVIVLILIGLTYYRLPWRKLPDPGRPRVEPTPEIIEPAIPAPQPAKPGAYAESP